MYGVHPYRLDTVIGLLRGPANPVKEFFRTRLPNTLALRAEFEAESGPILVEPGAHPGSQVGSAFDVAIRMALHPTHRPLVHDVPSHMWRDRQQRIVDQVVTRARKAQLRGDQETFLRACWALGMVTNAMRNMQALVASPSSPLMYDHEDPVGPLLELAEESAVRELGSLLALAADELVPFLPKPRHPAPAGWSTHIIAEPDLLAGDTLVELKVTSGVKHRRTGVRSDTRTALEIWQLLAYALLDFDDELGMRRIAIYSARYGTYFTWDIADVLARLSGTDHTPQVFRFELRNVLEGFL